MAQKWNGAAEELADAVETLGFPRELGFVVAEELRGEKSIRRLTAYVRAARPSSAEQIVDEMLAIASQRDAWVERKVSERANAQVTAFLNTGFEHEVD